MCARMSSVPATEAARCTLMLVSRAVGRNRGPTSPSRTETVSRPTATRPLERMTNHVHGMSLMPLPRSRAMGPQCVRSPAQSLTTG